MQGEEKAAMAQTTMDKVIADHSKLEQLKASTTDVEAEANQQHHRSLDLNASFHEKLAALNAGSIALAVSVGVALLGKAAPHSAFLHTNLGWLVIIACFLWFSLICAFGHNILFIKIARLESDKAAEWSRWIGLLNVRTMQSITGTGDSEIAKTLSKLVSDTFHDRTQKAAMNQHHTEQSILRAKVLGYLAVRTFLIAYTLVFACIVRIWWVNR